MNLSAVRNCRRVLLQWQRLYARLANECGPMLGRKLDYNLPPADHVRVLEEIEAFTPLRCQCTAYCMNYPNCPGAVPSQAAPAKP